jgi:hypothetical protein
LNFVPDVLGFLLKDALDLLKAENICVSIRETYSPYNKEQEGECRVIRQVTKKNFVELIVSYF